MLTSLLREDGTRWLESWEQTELPISYPREPRPVWLYLSLVAEHRRLLHRNGLGVAQHMEFLRAAFGIA